MLDADGKVLGERVFEHGGAGLLQMADWLLSFAKSDASEVGVAAETPRGPARWRPAMSDLLYIVGRRWLFLDRWERG